MALTRVDHEFACLGALVEDGTWVRPGPIWLKDVMADVPRYSYIHRVWMNLGLSSAEDSRPEDREIQGEPRTGERLGEAERTALLHAYADADVVSAFARKRSLGMIRAHVHRVYLKRSIGGREFIRIVFEDGAGEVYDWIVPELRFDVWARTNLCNPTVLELNKLLIFLTLGLTKPNDRFPGKFNGCHPLIVGVHTVPDYQTIAL